MGFKESRAESSETSGIVRRSSHVFGDTYAVTYEDLDHSQQERRFMLIGASARRRLLIIAYEHRGATIRIINARRLTRRERKMYEEEDR